MTLSRSFKVALLISAVTHAGVFALLDREPIAQKLLAAPRGLVAKRPKPRVVRFELVDTPASAETPEPPEKSSLVSDKNTRAQDRFKGEKKLEDSPHLDGKSSDSKDTRPKAVVARPVAPAKPDPVKPDPRETPREETVKREKEPLLRAAPGKKPVKPTEDAPIAPEPKEKEIIRLAKKAPAEIRLAPPPVPAARPAPPVPAPMMVSGVTASNLGGDAEITGEISFGATRHFFGEYLLKMKQAVETEWISNLVSQYSGVARSLAVVDFKIQPDGRVTDITVSSSEGDPYFPLICESSIRAAQPLDEIPYSEIPGLPEEFVDKPLNIRFTFRYN